MSSAVGGRSLQHILGQRVLAVVHPPLFREAQQNQGGPSSVMGFIMLCLPSASLRIDIKIQVIPIAQLFYLPKQNLALIKLSGRSLRIDFLPHRWRRKFNEYSIWQNPISCTFMLV